MKKCVVVFFLAVSLFTFSLQAENIKLNDASCYSLSFATIAFSPIHLLGAQLKLEDHNQIIFRETDGKIVGQLTNVGYILVEAPLEKCKEKDKPDFSQILR